MYSSHRYELFSLRYETVWGVLRIIIYFLLGLQSYAKTSAEQNKLIYFFCRVHCNLTLKERQSYEKSSEKPNSFELFRDEITSLTRKMFY